MCGIAGTIEWPVTYAQGDLSGIAVSMADTLQHRGPDDAGAWVDPSAGVAFGFRRLAIIDLTDAGHQPMHSPCGRYVIVFNGEIYNHYDLRAELEADRSSLPYRGHSDTETLLHGFTRWGVEETIRRAVGMFAFAVWDKQSQTLTLGRDRLGEKPLYYGWAGRSFVFGSELSALQTHPEFRADINRDALALYLRLKYVPAPHSIYSDVWKLLPGTLLTVSPEAVARRTLPPARPYWSALDTAIQGVADPYSGSHDDAFRALKERLLDAVRGQMVADVPLGAFLSGGIDSSTIVALMQTLSSRPVRTFTVGFAEKQFNEAHHARAVASHLGTDHTELLVSPVDAMSVIPSLATRYDEPFGDSSQIPTTLIAQLARQHVTVSLSGDGGDEVFAGYNRYLGGYTAWQKSRRVPSRLRGPLASTLEAASAPSLNRVVNAVQHVLPGRYRVMVPAEKATKLAAVLKENAATLPGYYQTLISDWDEPIVLGLKACPHVDTATDIWHNFEDGRQAMMVLDMLGYLPGDILTKVDRAGMSVSLETRMPFLDHRVVESAWRLPMELKVSRGTGKVALRRILSEYLPASLIDRPKAGFGIPLAEWLRGPLRSWADDLLSPDLLTRQGLLDPQEITMRWNQHRDGERDHHHALWNVLMFQSWLAEQH